MHRAFGKSARTASQLGDERREQVEDHGRQAPDSQDAGRLVARRSSPIHECLDPAEEVAKARVQRAPEWRQAQAPSVTLV